jgi:hypothetical protein
MICAKNDFLVKDVATDKFPETYWAGDKWQCPECGAEIATGFGSGMTPQAVEAYARAAALEFGRDPI